jgi:hypothetical protein
MRYDYYRDKEWVLSPVQNTKQTNTECYRRHINKVDKGGLAVPLAAPLKARTVLL